MELAKYRLKNGVEVQISVDQELELYCDPQKIAQVFVNLFNNSFDAMNENGGNIYIQALPSKDRMLFRYVDNGPGIPEKFSDRTLRLGFSFEDKFVE